MSSEDKLVQNDRIDLETLRGYQEISSEPIAPDIALKPHEEGSVTFHIPDAKSIYDAPAFFNPVMVLNRDLTMLFCETYASMKDYKLRVIEPLAGIGIRAYRMAIEGKDFIDEILINDFGDISIDLAKYNIANLKVQDKIHLFKREARSILTELAALGYRYHYLDLDPFGPPTPFIDNVWPVLALGALVAITATDMTALCGVYPKACLRKYGSHPLNNFHTHETAARILIATVVKSAARQERGVKPVFTAGVDHYTKIFFKAEKRSAAANEAVAQIGFSHTCVSCNQIYYIPGPIATKVECCGQEINDIAGPLWTGDLFNKKFCEQALYVIENREDKLESHKRITKILNEGIDGYDLHGYYSMETIGRQLHLSQPKMKTLEAEVKKKGYRLVKSTFVKQSFRTDMPGKDLMKLIEKLVLDARG